MTHVVIRSTLLGLLFLAPKEALACHGENPEELVNARPTAIVLTTISNVSDTGVKAAYPRWDGPAWVAKAAIAAQLYGKTGLKEIEFKERGPGECGVYGRPTIGEYYVVYLQRSNGKYYSNVMPYWWANRSRDPRLAKLRKLLPLGPVRNATPEEARILDLAEPRVRLPNRRAGLKNYTRLYARSSPSSLRVKFFRSRTPQRLMLDHVEAMPDPRDCRCDMQEQVIDLEDLQKTGQLPPLNR